jgi:UDP-N-acetylmuramoyl-L-alanyl-D-glutamate--2,6-diaminopimelate ligase
MNINDIMKDIPHIKISGDPSMPIRGIAYDSRKIKSEYLFAALKGSKADGNEFIEDALKKGAAAVLSENPVPPHNLATWIQTGDARETLARCSANFFGHPSSRMKVAGITGTKGKTTVTYLLESILLENGHIPGVIGTISYRGPGLEQAAERTTPEAPDLQRILRTLLDNGASHCVMEISSHSLDLKRARGIHFDAAVFTNLSGEHLDYHDTMDRYFAAKKKLFTIESHTSSVINSDDAWGEKLIREFPERTVTFGCQSRALVHPLNYIFSRQGIKASVKCPSGVINVNSSLLGRPNLYNILAAISTALILNIPPPAIEKGIAKLTRIPGRFEKISNPLNLNIYVDYAHTDDALKNLLETAAELTPGRIILVFGAGGDRDKTKRPRMGIEAGKLADWTIITSDNPRSEDPDAIIAQIESGIKQTGTRDYETEPDREKAIQKALTAARPGDTVLIAGKGHETYQIIKDKTIHFDDREIVKKAIEQMKDKIHG